MESNTIVTLIGGLVILGLIIVAITIRFKTKQSADGEKQAKEFLNGLSEVFQYEMIEIVNNFDFKLYNSLEEAEAAILLSIYETIWEYVSLELEKISKNDILSALTVKVLTKDFVSNFVSNLMTNNKISEKIEEHWVEKVKNINDEVEKIDKELQVEFDNPELYHEEVDVSDLPVAEVKEEVEEPENIDSEQDYDPEMDNSVELVEDDKYFYDKNGRRRDKETGRFV